jgi:hypothetical protein
MQMRVSVLLGVALPETKRCTTSYKSIPRI